MRIELPGMTLLASAAVLAAVTASADAGGTHVRGDYSGFLRHTVQDGMMDPCGHTVQDCLAHEFPADDDEKKANIRPDGERFAMDALVAMADPVLMAAYASGDGTSVGDLIDAAAVLDADRSTPTHRGYTVVLAERDVEPVDLSIGSLTADGGGIAIDRFPMQAVPGPGALPLLGLAALAMGSRRRRR